jgi:hypothetical protein
MPIVPGVSEEDVYAHKISLKQPVFTDEETSEIMKGIITGLA